MIRRTCRGCGNAFITAWKRKWFCSTNCLSNHRASCAYETCMWCGEHLTESGMSDYICVGCTKEHLSHHFRGEWKKQDDLWLKVRQSNKNDGIFRRRTVIYHTSSLNGEAESILENKPCKVYFIGDEHGRVKIGISYGDIENRISSLQTATADKLTLLAIEVANVGRERELHAVFSHLNIRGEWFEMAPELRDYIYLLRQENDNAGAEK